MTPIQKLRKLFLAGMGHANMHKRGSSRALRVIHFMLGNGALAAAITNILLGLLMQSLALPTWIIVFPIAFVVFHFGMNEMMVRHEVEQYQREIGTILYPKAADPTTGSSVHLVDHSFSNPSEAFDNQIETTNSELGTVHRTTMKARLPYDAIRKRMFTAYLLGVILFTAATLVSLHLTLRSA